MHIIYFSSGYKKIFVEELKLIVTWDIEIKFDNMQGRKDSMHSYVIVRKILS